MFNTSFFQNAGGEEFRRHSNLFHKKIKIIGSFSVTKMRIGRIKKCIGQEIKIVRQILKI